MTSYKSSDIILIPFPFTDLETSKKRPALVLSIVSGKKLPPLLVTAMITSQLESEKLPGDILLKDWEKAGLIHPSKLRLSKIVTVEEKIILKKLGILSTQDEKTVKASFRKVFSDWI